MKTAATLSRINQERSTIMEHATQKHTPAVDFILDEVLYPFTESELYKDYQQDWIERHTDNDNADEQFNALYDESLEIIKTACNSHKALVEALEKALNERIKMFQDPADDALCLTMQAALTLAKGGK